MRHCSKRERNLILNHWCFVPRGSDGDGAVPAGLATAEVPSLTVTEQGRTLGQRREVTG